MQQGLHLDTQIPVDNQGYFKMDKMYYNSLTYVKISGSIMMTIEWIKALLLCGITAWYFSSHGTTSSKYFAPLICAITLSVVTGTVYLLLILMTRSIVKNMVVAKEVGHIVESHYDSRASYDDFIDWVSDIYNANEPDNIVRSEPAQKVLSTMITHYYFVINKDLNGLFKFCDLSLFSIVIWLVVEMATNDIDTSFKTVLIAYIVCESLLRWRFLLLCIVVALLPLLCVGVVIATIFCKPKQRTASNYINQLEVLNYRDSIPLQHGIECMICFTNFYPDEKIVILDCVGSHAFHEICIKTWFQVGSTCPICRTDFNDR